MNPRRLALFVFALSAAFAASGCFQVNDKVDQPAVAAKEPAPRFTIDVGMKDVWDQKKTGPFRMEISPNGKYLMLMGHSKKANVQVWDLEKQTRLHAFDDENGTMNMPIAVAPDGETGAYVGLRVSQGIAVVSLTNGKILRVIKDKKDRFSSFCKGLHFSPKGDLLVLAINRDILIFDPKTGNPVLEWQDAANVQALSNFFEDGKKIASINENGDAQIWEVATGKLLQTLKGGDQTRTLAMHAATFSNDGKIAISRDAKYKIWDVPNGKLLHEINEPLAGYPNIRILPGNRSVVWNTSRGLVIYDLETGAKKQEVKTSETHVYAVAVKPDGSMILTSSDDSTIKGWTLNAEGKVE